MSSQLDSWISKPDEDNGPLMTIASYSLVGVSAAFLAVRLWIRQSQSKLWLDDAVLGLSWVLLLVFVTLNQQAINLGYGKHALDVDLSHFEKMTYYGASGLTFSIASITLSKISFGVTLLRLTDGWLRWYVYFAMATLAIFAVPVMVIPWVQCKPLAKTFVDIFPGECIDKRPSIRYGRFQAIWSAIMDISLSLIPWKVLWNLQMRTAEKVGAGVAMSLGILAGATAVVRAKYIEQLAYQDLSYDSYNSIIWAAAESAMAIVATSIPVLRVFLKQVVENYQTTQGTRGSRSSKSRNNGSSNNSTALSNRLQRANKKNPAMSEKSSNEESLVDVSVERDSKSFMEMEALVVDEATGRVTMRTPDTLPDASERHVSTWPLGKQA